MNISARGFVLASALVVSASIPAFADTNLITNGGFETGDFTGYTVIAGATGVSAAGGPGSYNPNSGTYYAYLGNVGGLGTISQTVTDTAGQEYALSYFLASNGTSPNEFQTSVDGTVLDDLVNIGIQGYTEYSFTFTGTGSDTIMFGERNDPNYLALDDVSVTTAAVTGVTPEPSSIALLGSGMLGVAGLVRRRMARV